MRAVPRFMLPAAAAVLGMLAVQAAQAQGQVRSARQAVPSAAARAAQAAPSPNGLRFDGAHNTNAVISVSGPQINHTISAPMIYALILAAAFIAGRPRLGLVERSAGTSNQTIFRAAPYALVTAASNIVEAPLRSRALNRLCAL
mgnify:CR=1 FL=1